MFPLYLVHMGWLNVAKLCPPDGIFILSIATEFAFAAPDGRGIHLATALILHPVAPRGMLLAIWGIPRAYV